jgi:hypothetical protein
MIGTIFRLYLNIYQLYHVLTINAIKVNNVVIDNINSLFFEYIFLWFFIRWCFVYILCIYIEYLFIIKYIKYIINYFGEIRLKSIFCKYIKIWWIIFLCKG